MAVTQFGPADVGHCFPYLDEPIFKVYAFAFHYILFFVVHSLWLPFCGVGEYCATSYVLFLFGS